MPAQPDTTDAGIDFPVAAETALRDAAGQAALDATGASLIRLFGTAVYHLPASDAVARIAQITSPTSVTRLDTSIKVTRWLTTIGFPTVEPLAVPQPVTSNGCAITFWRHLPQDDPEPGVTDLGRLLRELHQLDPAPVELPAYRPLGSVRRAIEASTAISEHERTWLRTRCDYLLDAYDALSFELPPGLIHGDAWRGNLLRDGRHVVLLDWDSASIGPREIDLIPTLQATRFGLPEGQRRAFVCAYGRDIRSWEGYPVLREIRELSTLTALLRDAVTRTSVRRSWTSGSDRYALGMTVSGVPSKKHSAQASSGICPPPYRSSDLGDSVHGYSPCA
jgi:aminoglycoside phosphotransferase